MKTANFQPITNTAPMSADTHNLVRENVMQFYVKQQGLDEPEGITALYSRLSQEDKNDGESNSIATQKKILERYCKERGYTAIRHYDEDDGYSGTNFNRPSFQCMLADVKAGKIARVIVKEPYVKQKLKISQTFFLPYKTRTIRNANKADYTAVVRFFDFKNC